VLVDTQAAVWSSFHPERISRRATEALAKAWNDGRELCVADITLWEISMAAAYKKVTLPHSLSAYLKQIEQRFRVLPITATIAERSLGFSEKYPGDPADRLIGATALISGLQLVTSDKRIRKSGEVPCIW